MRPKRINLSLNDGTPVQLDHDGLLYHIPTQVCLEKLKHLPKDKTGIFFNSSKDRYCVEFDVTEKGISIVNPGVFYLFNQ